MSLINKDPLSGIKIKYKLPLSFVAISLLAFVVGGFIIVNTVRANLLEQIKMRLKSETGTYATIFDQHLLMLGRRSQDFASDGFIRKQTNFLQQSDAAIVADHQTIHQDLIRHLKNNKLPIVDEFTNLDIFSINDSLLATVINSPSRSQDDISIGLDSDTLWYSPLFQDEDNNDNPIFYITTPLVSIDKNSVIGHLVATIEFSKVIVNVSGKYNSAFSSSDIEKYLTFIDQSGSKLDIPWWVLNSPENLSVLDVELQHKNTNKPNEHAMHEGIHECRSGLEMFGYSFPLKFTGWNIIVELSTENAMTAITLLENKLLYTGAIVGLLILLTMYFPVQFLIRPLGELREMATTIKDGDLSTRIQNDSTDEIGDLAQTFNQMAIALEERTKSLKKTSIQLSEREREALIQRDRLNSVVKSMTDGLILLNSRGEIVLSNTGGTPLIQHLKTNQDKIGKLDCGRINDDSPSECLHCLMDLASTRSCTLKMNNRYYEVVTTSLPSMNKEKGKILVSRDITERIQLHEKENRQDRLSVLGNMAAVVAHEMNSPLAAISMYNQMMADDEIVPDEFQEHIEVIERNTKACQDIINNLLDYARTPTLKAESFDIHNLISDCISMLKPAYNNSQIQIQFDVKKNNEVIIADEGQIKQIVINIILNAIQAVDPVSGQVKISTNFDIQKNQLAISIQDNGPGISNDISVKIFDPFFTTRGPDKGTGLGLSTARRISEAHGGKLDLVNWESGNTIFTLTLPINRELNT
mgnify:CR=1 FL=1